jgi:hypothetical protein
VVWKFLLAFQSETFAFIGVNAAQTLADAPSLHHPYPLPTFFHSIFLLSTTLPSPVPLFSFLLAAKQALLLCSALHSDALFKCRESEGNLSLKLVGVWVKFQPPNIFWEFKWLAYKFNRYDFYA